MAPFLGESMLPITSILACQFSHTRLIQIYGVSLRVNIRQVKGTTIYCFKKIKEYLVNDIRNQYFSKGYGISRFNCTIPSFRNRRIHICAA